METENMTKKNHNSGRKVVFIAENLITEYIPQNFTDLLNSEVT